MSGAGKRVVVLDDEPNMGKVLTKLLALEGFEVLAFTSASEALAALQAQGACLLLSDLRMPEMTGEEVLEEVRRRGIETEVILMTAYGTVDSAMRCVKAGARDYVTKPFDTKSLLGAVRAAAEAWRLRQGGPAMVRKSSSGSLRRDLLIGASPELEAIRSLIVRFAPVDSPVLISGESGTGKELVARSIHELSPRAAKAFVAINCASIPENLIESELFGHERGAFTGAQEARIGLMEAAHGGTMFLDEIGELPLALQARFLRALQEREITRVGANKPIAIDVRVLSATNRRLAESVNKGEFREDLYYRLNVLSVKLPPLRARQGDVVVLAEFFLREFAGKAGKPSLAYAPEVLTWLQAQPWPGNIRELRNTVERLVVLSDRPIIDQRTLEAQALLDSQRIPVFAQTPFPAGEDLPEFREARDRFEAEYIRSVLAAADGNVTEAARKAGMSRRNFYEKMEKLGIET